MHRSSQIKQAGQGTVTTGIADCDGHTAARRLQLNEASSTPNADSMSLWRHEIPDFQTGKFLNLNAKGCAI
jgi:hypothetical protein